MIPNRLIRTVPATTSDEVEAWWQKACELHPTWEHITFRDPIDPTEFPLTSARWRECTSGAQLAGLIRLEALYHLGGHYLDSDVELYRPLNSLTSLRGYAAWEDANVVPDAVLGFEAEHPVVARMIVHALDNLANGAWASGPGATTQWLPGRADVLLLPPGSFFPYHYKTKHRYNPATPSGRSARARIPQQQPWAFGAHHWHASWLSRT